MTEREKLFTKVFIGVIALYFFYLIRGILFPFIMGIILAYFFNPLANKMQKKLKMKRYIVSLVIISIFTLFLAIIITFLVPILFNQLAFLIREFATYFAEVDEIIYQKISNLLNSLGIKNGSREMHLYFQQFNKDMVRIFGKMINNLFSSSIAFVGLISALFITPTTAYYFLKDWNKIIKRINSFIPKSQNKMIHKLFRQIDVVLSSYVKGQFSVCLMLGIFYALLLTFAGLKSALFVGIISGLLTIIPYFGATLGFALGTVLAYFQWGFNAEKLSLILGIYILGQFIEGNFVTPKLMSNRIQLHPIWVIFALFAGGALGGFWGIVLSLPIAAVLSVSIRFLIKEYSKKNVSNR